MSTEKIVILQLDYRKTKTMTSKKYIFTAVLGAISLHAAAQCRIKDEIMGNHPLKELNGRVPDGVMESSDKNKPSDKKQVSTPKKAAEASQEHCHHSQDVHCEEHCDGNHPHNALKLRASDEEYSSFSRFRLGGYGEMISAFKGYGLNRFATKEGNTLENRATISIPRFVLALDYKINPKWVVGAEIEFESGGTGITAELENAKNGATSTELSKGGEVIIEQFHITRLVHPAFNLRFGHMVVPMGLTNAHHEPLNFFGTARPEGETSIIPSTWHETGLAAYGTFGRGLGQFDYHTMLVSGLNAQQFRPESWVHQGQQGLFEQDNFTNPAWMARLDWVGVPGLRLGASFYYCSNTTNNAFIAEEVIKNTAKVPVTLWSVDAQWLNKYVEARANIVSGNVGNADAFGRMGEKKLYMAERAISCAAEVGFNLKHIFNTGHTPDLLPFVRYEYYNPQHAGTNLATHVIPMSDVFETSMWVAGLNYRLGKDIVLKADYTHRKIAGGALRSENEFAIGAAFNAWFLSR